jgi:Na+/proline symporter
LWTDTFQTFVVIGGLIGIITIGSSQLGGFEKVWDIAEKGGRIDFFKYVDT